MRRKDNSWKYIIYVIVVLFLFSFVANLLSGNENYLLVTVSLVPSAILAFSLYLGRDDSLFTPMNLIFANIFISVTAQTYYFCFLDGGLSRFGLYGLNDFNSLLYGNIIVSIAMLCLVSGHFFGGVFVGARSKNKFQLDKFQLDVWNSRVVYSVVFLMIAISLYSLVLYARKFNIFTEIELNISAKRRLYDDVGKFESGVFARFGANLSQTAFFIAYIHYLVLRKNNIKSALKPLLIVLFVIGCIFPFIASSRAGLVNFVLCSAVIFHFLDKGLKWRHISYLILVAFAVVIIMGLLRFSSQSGSFSITDYTQRRNSESVLGVVLASNNFVSIGKTSIVVDSIPDQFDYLYGESYFYWVYAAVPRAIWPNKPPVKLGLILGPKIFGSNLNTGVPPGAIGEAYINFGIYGVVFVLFLTGAFLR